MDTPAPPPSVPRGAEQPDGLALRYAALLDGVADGVLSITPDHRIEVLNATGAAILGRDAAALTGGTLADAFLLTEGSDEFVDAVLAPLTAVAGTVRGLASFRRAGEMRQLSVTSTRYRPRSGPLQGAPGVVATFSDVTEVLRLRAAEEQLTDELRAEHAKLVAAFAQLEEAAARERRIAQRTRLLRRAAILAALVLFVGVGAYAWRSAAPPVRATAESAGGEAGTVVVTPRAILSLVSVVGTVDAGSVVNVVGPFDGMIQQKNFVHGGPVERDKPLLTLDTADLTIRLREAEGAEIKAKQRLDELRDWLTGPDVARARRALASAELESGALRGRVAQTKMLLSKGIVPADEYTQLVQQQRNQDLQVASSREELTAALGRGDEQNRRVAEFEMLNARAKVQELRRDLANATVLTPASGVVLLPEQEGGKRADLIGVGSRVTRGQTMLTIGDLESFTVRAKVDEIDVNKIRVGQDVTVTGDSFDDAALHGTVTSVAAQASGESTVRTGMAVFPVTVSIADLTPEQRANVRVGMSANLAIVAYENTEALVVPPSAVREEAGARVVRVRRDGSIVSVPVVLGISQPDGVEVRRGLMPGDVVLTGE